MRVRIEVGTAKDHELKRAFDAALRAAQVAHAAHGATDLPKQAGMFAVGIASAESLLTSDYYFSPAAVEFFEPTLIAYRAVKDDAPGANAYLVAGDPATKELLQRVLVET